MYRHTAPRPSRHGLARTAFVIATALAFAACDSGSNGITDPGGDPGGGPGGGAGGGIGTAFAAIPAWEVVSPPVAASADPKFGDPTGDASVLAETDPRYSTNRFCTARPYSLAKNPGEIVTLSPDVGLLVPGVLLQGKSHVLGSLQQLQIPDRAPITLVINELGTGNPARVVADPNLGTLQTAVNQLVQDAETSGFDYGSDVLFDQVTSYSQEQAMLSLGFSARYLNAQARGRLESNTSAERTTVTASYTQDAFSIRAEGPGQGADWFTDGLTQAEVDALTASGQIGPDNPPLYVLEVTYGRIATVTLTSSEDRSAVEGMFQASVNGGVGNVKGRLDASQERLVRESEIKIVSLGGPAAGAFQFAKEILQPNDPSSVGLDGFFAQDVALTTFAPISYTLADLRTGNVVRVGEVTDYEQLECAGTLRSSFDGGAEGWSATSQSRFGSLTLGATPHSGAGALNSYEDDASISVFRAPARFLGPKSEYLGATITYWTQWGPGLCETTLGPVTVPTGCPPPFGTPLDTSRFPDVRIESSASPKILVFADDAPAPPRDTWVQRSFDLAPGPEVRVYNPTAGETIANAVPATEADIAEVIANISRFEVRAEHRSGYIERVSLDTFSIGAR